MPERTGDGEGVAIVVPIDLIRPNDWNPNVQPDWIYEKELGSIRKFGFVDPLIVREKHHPMGLDDWYEIVDGFHRWRAAKQLGYTELPCWNLGVIDDADARELTVVLNETRGKPDEARLRVLLEDLVKRRGEESVREIMPFSRQRFDELVGRRTVDWGALEERRQALNQQSEGRWKEVVFRMPYDAAKVVEDAINTVREREGLEHSWQALQMICAEREA